MKKVIEFKFYIVSDGDSSVGIPSMLEEITMTSTYNDRSFNALFEKETKDYLENIFDNGTIVNVYNEKEYFESLEHYHNKMMFESFINDLARQKVDVMWASGDIAEPVDLEEEIEASRVARMIEREKQRVKKGDAKVRAAAAAAKARAKAKATVDVDDDLDAILGE